LQAAVLTRFLKADLQVVDVANETQTFIFRWKHSGEGSEKVAWSLFMYLLLLQFRVVEGESSS